MYVFFPLSRTLSSKSQDDRVFSPMEMAQRQNQKLLAAYQARIARSGTAKQQQATLVRNDHSQIIFRSTYILKIALDRANLYN